MKVLQKPTRNKYNTKQNKPNKQKQKTVKNKKKTPKTNLPTVVNQITWCFTMTTKTGRRKT